MILDEPEKLTPEPKLNPVQKIALGFEIFLVVLLALGVLFKVMSYPFSNELLILSMTSLPMLYLFIPILLFRGKKIVDHLFSHLAGSIFAVVLISVLFKWMTWAYWPEMYQIALSVHLLFTLALFFLLITHRNQLEKRKFYFRVVLRVLLMLFLLVS